MSAQNLNPIKEEVGIKATTSLESKITKEPGFLDNLEYRREVANLSSNVKMR